MTYQEQYRGGQLALPSALLFHFHELFPSADDFLVWQFFFLQNTTNLAELAPSQIAKALGKTVSQVNQSIENLQAAQLLDFKTIELAGEIEMIFDAFPALEKLDSLVNPKIRPSIQPTSDLKGLVSDFERELGRMLSPFEIEDLQKTLQEDQISVELVLAALREAVFSGKTNWRYIQAILRNWRREGITTLAQVEAKQAEREAQTAPNVQVSDDFLAAMNLFKE